MFNWTVAETECTTPIKIWLGIGIAANTVFFVSASILILKFIKRFDDKAKNMSKALYHSGLSFFILSLLTLLLFTPINLKCQKAVPFKYLKKAGKLSYSVHCYFYIVLWFLRLYYAFCGTVFSLHKCTLIFFSVFGAVGFLGLLYGINFQDTHSEVGLAVTVCLGLLFLTWIIFLVSLFIYKLVKVYRNVNANKELIKIITKITILSIVSICCSTVYFLLMIVIAVKIKDNIHAKLLRDFTQLFSIYMNLICVLLSYNCFDPLYGSVCGLMNRRCTTCWRKVVGKSETTLQTER